jgi:hypothetical protein
LASAAFIRAIGRSGLVREGVRNSFLVAWVARVAGMFNGVWMDIGDENVVEKASSKRLDLKNSVRKSESILPVNERREQILANDSIKMD